MAEPFTAEIMMFAGDFAPRNFAFCDGNLLSISANEALFSLVGTIYGGDGRSTFGIPDLRGRLPLHPGSGPGLDSYRLGDRGGTEFEFLTTQHLPSHTHVTSLHAENVAGDSANQSARMLAKTISNPYVASDGNAGNNKTFDSQAITVSYTGDTRPHSNMQPYLVINFVIALYGIYPSSY